MLHPPGLRYALLGYAAPYWAILHLTPPRGTLLSYAAPYRDTLHPIDLCCTLRSYAAPYWDLLHSIWASLHPESCAAPSELSCTLLSYADPFELRCTLLSYNTPFWATPHPNELRCTRYELHCTLKNIMSPVYWYCWKRFFSSAEGFGRNSESASISVLENGIPSFFLFRGRIRNGIPRFSVPRNSRNSVGNNHLFRLFRLPRNYFLSEIPNPSQEEGSHPSYTVRKREVTSLRQSGRGKSPL